MTQAPSIKDALKAAMRAFKACRPIERVACQDFGMQQDDILEQQLEAALSAALATLQPSGERREAIAREPFAWAYRSIFNEHSWTLLKAEPHFDNDQYIKKPLYLASGLVQDEAGIRADEREKCAKLCDERAVKLRAKETGMKQSHAHQYYDRDTEARVIAAAIRSGRDGGEG